METWLQDGVGDPQETRNSGYNIDQVPLKTFSILSVNITKLVHTIWTPGLTYELAQWNIEPRRAGLGDPHGLFQPNIFWLYVCVCVCVCMCV